MGSETRQRRFVVAVRLTPDERAELVRRADDHGLTLSDYARSVLLDRLPLGLGPRRRRVPSRAEAELSRLSVSVASLAYELNKIGVNVNQLAHNANAGYAVPRAEVAKAARALERSARGMGEIRNAILEALGLDYGREQPPEPEP